MIGRYRRPVRTTLLAPAPGVRREGHTHMLKGFKDFLLRGNVMDLAIAVVIGTAFTTVVTAIVKGFIDPLIGLFVMGNLDNQLDFTIFKSHFNFGMILSALIYFTIVAAVIYFLIVIPMKKIMERRARGEEPPSDTPPSEDIALLTEIRDLLRAQQRQ
mgnify:FL=1